MGKTKIEYLDRTWNPIAMRCTPCSPGCAHCWHLRMADRLVGKARKDPWAISFLHAYSGCGPPLLTAHLKDPLHWKKPSRIGVQFMGDWMHPNITDDHILKIFQVMGGAFWHIYFLLTKRPERISEVFGRISPLLKIEGRAPLGLLWNHIYLGVTVCHPDELWKVKELLKIPGFKKWVSYEPALGPIDLHKTDYPAPGVGRQGAVTSWPGGLSWVVAGAETGPGARPADNEWFRRVRDDCRVSGVPYFQKATTGPTPEDLQVGEWPE